MYMYTHTHTHTHIYGETERKKEREVVRQHFSWFIHFPLHTVCSSVSLLRKYSSITRKVSKTSVGIVGSGQTQILPYSSLHLLLKSTAVPKVHSIRLMLEFNLLDLWLQSYFPSSLLTQSLVFCFVFRPTSACRPPSTVFFPPRPEGQN